MRRRRSLRGERGSASLELVIIAPGLLVIICVLVFAGRVAMAHQALDAAAADAVRAASIARTRSAANGDASRAATSSLNNHLKCSTLGVRVNTAGFDAPVGTPATITADLSCSVYLADLAVPGIPGHLDIHSSAASSLDTYRER